jgi:predicted amidohydrolase
MNERIRKILCVTALTVSAVLFPSGCSTGAADGVRGAGGFEAREGLTVTGIQLHIDEAIYSSPSSFEAAMRRELERACSGPDYPDLVIFPEYTSVFLAAADYSHLIHPANTFEEVLDRIHGENESIESLRSLFLREADRTEKRLDRIWGELARDFGVCLVGGTYFRKTAGPAGEPVLRNTLALYDARGRRIYEQDKVYLTEFEKTVLGLSPGREAGVAPVRIDSFDVAFTICRDSFFPSWEDNFVSAEVWVSIKANGVSFDQDARRTFKEALPERIAESDVPYGIVVCLTGRFLDLFWEGESSVIVDAGETVQVLEKSRTPWYGDAVDLTLPQEGVP